MAEILDSGNRREFESGAVRDIQEGKGRCDLMPLDVLAEVMHDPILKDIYGFTQDNDTGMLMRTINDFCHVYSRSVASVFLNLSKHFEAGAQKYGERNWEKGIPVHCYIDSAVRHYLKMIDGWTDEPHDRAFIWNIVCCIWTVEHGKGV